MNRSATWRSAWPVSSMLRVAVGCVLVVAPLLLGGAHPSVNVGLAAALVALLWVRLRTSDGTVPLTPPVLAVVAAFVATLLQLVPLPIVLLRLVSPGTYDVLTLDKARSWAPISLDLPGTAHEAVKLAACTAGALLATSLFLDRKHRVQLATWVSAAAGVVTAVGFAHALAGVTRPYGAFGFPAGHQFVSTFINPNHLAAFLGLGSLLALGLAAAADGGWRLTHLGNAALCGAGVFLTLSRGAMIAYVAAVMFLASGFAVERARRAPPTFWVQLGLAGALLIAGAVAYPSIVHELWTLSGPDALSKTEIWRPVPAMLLDFPLGSGRGAFYSIYPRYQLHAAAYTFTHLENEWLQVLVDWGPLVGLALLVAVGASYVRLLRRATGRPLRLAVAGALLFLGIQNLGDFSLTLGAVALPAAMLLVAFAGRPRERPAFPEGAKPKLEPVTEAWSRRLPRDLRRPFVQVTAGLLAVTTVVCGWSAIRHDIQRDTEAVKQLLGQAGSEPELAAIFARHPADPILALLVGQQALRERDGAKRALHWINRGLFLAPGSSMGHRLAGRALLQMKARGQALLEFRLGCEAEPNQTRSIASEVWTLTRKVDDVAKLAGESASVRLDVAEIVLGLGGAQQSLQLLEGLETRDGGLRSAELRGRAHLALGGVERALEEGAAAEREWPGEPAGYLLQAESLVRQGNTSEALELLQRGIKMVIRPEYLLQRRASILIDLGRLDEAHSMASKLVERTGGGRDSAAAYWLLGQIYQKQGRASLALREFERGRDRDPANLGYRLSIAGMREGMGDLRGARVELERAKVEVGSTPEVEAALLRLQRAAQNKVDQYRWQQVQEP